MSHVVFVLLLIVLWCGSSFSVCFVRKRRQDTSCILDEILKDAHCGTAGSEAATTSAATAAVSTVDDVTHSSEQAPATNTGPNFDQDTVNDSLVENSSPETAPRQPLKQTGGAVVRTKSTIDDSFVKESSRSNPSHTTSSKSRRSDVSAVADSLVGDSRSTSDSRTSESCKQAVDKRVPLGLTRETFFAKSSSSESHTNVHTSKQTKSSSGSVHTVDDSFVAQTSASTSSKDRSASSTASKQVVSDSLVSMTSSSAETRRQGLNVSDDNFVVPESPPPLQRTRTSDAPPAGATTSSHRIDISILDDLI